MALSKNLCLFVAGTALLAQGAQAQSLRDFHSEARTDMRASASLTIPLGARSRSDEAKPRFDFVVETQSLENAGTVAPLRFDTQSVRQKHRLAKVSFTLEQNPRLLLNDHRVATFGPRLTADEDEERGGGLGTAGLIVLGAGALVGVTVLFFDVLEDDVEDALGLDD